MKLNDILNENVEDQQSELNGEISELLKTAKPYMMPETFARARASWESANDTFSRGYEEDDDNVMYGGLDELEEVRDRLRNVVQTMHKAP